MRRARPGDRRFKRDWEVGIALHQGHTIYLVMFFPEPCPGQTLADVLYVLRRFVEEVAAQHPASRPFSMAIAKLVGR